MQIRFFFAPAAASAVVLAGLTFGAQDGEGFSPPGYAKARGPLVVAHDATLLDVVFAYEELAGQTIILEGNAQEALRRRSPHLAEDLEVQAPLAHAALEILLAENQFAVTLEESDESRWLTINDLTAADAESDELRERALPVSSEELLRMRTHPALLVTATVELPGVSARHVCNALRTSMTDTRIQAIVPSGDSGAVQITGCGKWAATMTAALLQLSADARASGESASASDLAAPDASGALQLESEPTMLDVLRRYESLTARRFVCSDETLTLLKQTRLNFFDGLSVQPQSVPDVVELFLAKAGFVVTDYGVDGVELYGVASSRTRRSNMLRAGAEFVPAGRVADGGLSPARLITTVLHLPGFDVRQAANSMRTSITDASTQSMLPLGNTGRMLLTGSGAWVSATAGLLRTVSDVASGKQEAIDRAAPDESAAASGPLRVEPGATLFSVTRQYEALTGLRFFFEQEIRALLESRRVELSRALTVPPQSVDETFELLASQNGFALEEPLDGIRLMRITSRKSRTLRIGGAFFNGPPSELRRHPARLFSVLLRLPRVDVRQLSNSMRTMITDANTQQMLPIGNTDFLMLTGFGANVAALARTLQGAVPPPARTEKPAGARPRLDFPASSEPLLIEKDAALSDVLLDYETKTGVHFLTSAESRAHLSERRANFPDPVSIPPSSAQAALEVLLAANGFVLEVHAVAEPKLVTVTSLDTSAGFNILASAQSVPESRVRELAQHPALLATTVLHLPDAPVRELCNSLRTMVTDANTQRIAPMGSSRSVSITGAGPWVEGMARLVRQCARDETARDAAAFPAFPEIRESLRVRRDTALIEVVREYERLTGKSLMLDGKTLERVERTSIEVPQDLDVPPARTQSVFESLLLQSGFALIVHDSCAPLELSVVPLEQAGGRVRGAASRLLGSALFVPEAQLEMLREHPGLLVQTAIELSGVDVQQLAQSPKGVEFNAGPARRLLAVGKTGQLVLVGPGSEVFALADALRRAVPGGDQR
ncbi:MAG: hypothetical protein GY711_24995 [bacterium]|nr:hypothetical protein [bacterium]